MALVRYPAGSSGAASVGAARPARRPLGPLLRRGPEPAIVVRALLRTSRPSLGPLRLRLACRVRSGAARPPPLRGPGPRPSRRASLAGAGPPCVPPRFAARPLVRRFAAPWALAGPVWLWPRPCFASGSLFGRPCFVAALGLCQRVVSRGVPLRPPPGLRARGLPALPPGAAFGPRFLSRGRAVFGSARPCRLVAFPWASAPFSAATRFVGFSPAPPEDFRRGDETSSRLILLQVSSGQLSPGNGVCKIKPRPQRIVYFLLAWRFKSAPYYISNSNHD